MKKYIITLLLSSTIFSSAFAFTVSPSAPTTKTIGQTISITGAGGIDNFTEYYSWWTLGNVMVAGSETLFHLNATVPVPSTAGQYRLRLTSSPTGGVFPPFPDFTSGIYTIVAPPPPPLSQMMNTASSSFIATTGFSAGGAVTSVGNMFIKPIIGGGIMLFQALLPWIIALIVLSAFFYFAYRAFRFYKH